MIEPSNDLAAACREMSEKLITLSERFDALPWKDHATYIPTMASHLGIYAYQIEAREKRGGL